MDAEQDTESTHGYHYQLRLILLGGSGVGKSSLLGRIKDPNYFCTEHMPTVGADFHKTMIEVEDKTFKIQLWDTAGQERFSAIVKSYYRNVVGGFLVFDVKERKSFDQLNKWVEEAKEGAYPHELALVLVGNKIDEDVNHPRVVSKQEAKEFARHFGMDYIETSAKTGQNIDNLLPFLATRVFWGLRVKDIVLAEGWNGVTEGDLCHSTLIKSQHMQPPSLSHRSCCK